MFVKSRENAKIPKYLIKNVLYRLNPEIGTNIVYKYGIPKLVAYLIVLSVLYKLLTQKRKRLSFIHMEQRLRKISHSKTDDDFNVVVECVDADHL